VLRYILPVILQNYDENKFQGSLNTYVLMFDIADFNHLSSYDGA
jgi:hypothetical protein